MLDFYVLYVSPVFVRSKYCTNNIKYGLYEKWELFCYIFCLYLAIVSAVKVCFFTDLEQYFRINDMKTLSDDQENYEGLLTFEEISKTDIT